MNIHWKDWCWSWNSNTLATWREELTPWKRSWYWERLKTGREGDDRGWDGWLASLTQWTWVWVSSRSWWWTRKPGVLQSMRLQRVGHDWASELNWTDRNWRFNPWLLSFWKWSEQFPWLLLHEQRWKFWLLDRTLQNTRCYIWAELLWVNKLHLKICTKPHWGCSNSTRNISKWKCKKWRG